MNDKQNQEFRDLFIKVFSFKGFQAQLLQVLAEMPLQTFLLKDVYTRAEILKEANPDINEFEADIRASLQQFRNKGLLIFLERGRYRLSDLFWRFISKGNQPG